ncbi:hypothetical protein ACOJBO_17900 [Rhizobium beringeri]
MLIDGWNLLVGSLVRLVQLTGCRCLIFAIEKTPPDRSGGFLILQPFKVLQRPLRV